MFGKFPFNSLLVGIVLVNLINGNNNWYVGCLGMINSLYGLIHDTIISCNYKDNNISYLGPSGTHFCKGFMSGGIQVDNRMAVKIDMIGSDMLCNPSGFTIDNVRFANAVQQRGLTMVNMAHNSYNR